jgi:O-antigen/teichoic acid export membrane protein
MIRGAQDRRSGLRSILVNAGWLWAAYLVTFSVRTAYIVVVARALGPHQYGLFTYGQSWYLVFLPFTTLGLTEIVARELGRQRTRAATYAGQTFLLQAGCGLVLAVICALLGWILEPDPYARTVLLVFATALIGRAIWLWAESIYRACEHTYYTFCQSAVVRLVELVAIASALWLGADILAVAAIHSLSWWIQALSGVLVVRRRIAAFTLVWPLRTLWGLLRRGVTVLVGVALIGWFREGAVVLYRFSSGELAQLADLAIAIQAFGLLAQVPGVAIASTLPVLSRSVERRDGKSGLFVDVTLRAGVVIGGALGILGVGLGPGVVELVFGSDYAHAGVLLGIALWLCIPWTLARALWLVLLAHGWYLRSSLGLVAGMVTMTGLLPGLVLAFGAAGSLIAVGLGLVVWMGCLIGFVMRLEVVDTRQALIKPTCALAAAVVAMLGAGALAPWLGTLVGLVVLATGTIALRIVTPEEWAALGIHVGQLLPLRNRE